MSLLPYYKHGKAWPGGWPGSVLPCGPSSLRTHLRETERTGVLGNRAPICVVPSQQAIAREPGWEWLVAHIQARSAAPREHDGQIDYDHKEGGRPCYGEGAHGEVKSTWRLYCCPRCVLTFQAVVIAPMRATFMSKSYRPKKTIGFVVYRCSTVKSHELYCLCPRFWLQGLTRSVGGGSWRSSLVVKLNAIVSGANACGGRPVRLYWLS